MLEYGEFFFGALVQLGRKTQTDKKHRPVWLFFRHFREKKKKKKKRNTREHIKFNIFLFIHAIFTRARFCARHLYILRKQPHILYKFKDSEFTVYLTQN